MTEAGKVLIDESPHVRQLAAILQQVCETTGWEYGEVWLPRPDSLTLHLSSVWYVRDRLESDRQLCWKQFRYCSEKFTLRYDEGLPGRVWASQAPEWIVDVSAKSESYFLRNQIAKAFGARAAFSLPVHFQDVQTIVAFFKSEACELDAQLVANTEAAFAQLL